MLQQVVQVFFRDLDYESQLSEIGGTDLLRYPKEDSPMIGETLRIEFPHQAKSASKRNLEDDYSLTRVSALHAFSLNGERRH